MNGKKTTRKEKKARLHKGVYTHTQQVTKETDTTTNKMQRTHTTRERTRDTTNRWVKKGKKAQQERQMMDGWMDGWMDGRMDGRKDVWSRAFFFC